MPEEVYTLSAFVPYPLERDEHFQKGNVGFVKPARNWTFRWQLFPGYQCCPPLRQHFQPSALGGPRWGFIVQYLSSCCLYSSRRRCMSNTLHWSASSSVAPWRTLQLYGIETGWIHLAQNSAMGIQKWRPRCTFTIPLAFVQASFWPHFSGQLLLSGQLFLWSLELRSHT